MGMCLWNANFWYRRSQKGTTWSTGNCPANWLTARRNVESNGNLTRVFPHKFFPHRTVFVMKRMRNSIKNMMRRWDWKSIILFLPTSAVQNAIYVTIRSLIATTTADIECPMQHQWYPNSTQYSLRNRYVPAPGTPKKRVTEMIRSAFLWINPSNLPTSSSTSIQLTSINRATKFKLSFIYRRDSY